MVRREVGVVFRDVPASAPAALFREEDWLAAPLFGAAGEALLALPGALAGEGLSAVSLAFFLAACLFFRGDCCHPAFWMLLSTDAQTSSPSHRGQRPVVGRVFSPGSPWETRLRPRHPTWKRAEQ